MSTNVTLSVSNTIITASTTTDTVNVSTTTNNVVVGTAATISDANVRVLLSANDAGGDGSFAYDNSTGVFTYTGPSQSEVVAHFSNVSPVNLESNGQISVDSSALFSGKTTDDLAQGTTNLYASNTSIRNAIGVAPAQTVLLYDQANGIFSAPSMVTQVNAGLGISGGGTGPGTVTVNVQPGNGITSNSSGVHVNLSDFDTDDLPEGSANLYYTNARVQSFVTDNGLDFNAEKVDDRVANLLVAGNSIDLTYNDSANTLTIDYQEDVCCCKWKCIW